MASWPGWVADLLTDLHAPHTNQNAAFLHEWETAEHISCAFNPLAVTVNVPHSTRCKRIAAGKYARAYPSQGVGAHATVTQFHEHAYTKLLDALISGDPFGSPDWQEVAGELGVWGAHRFASEYATAAGAGASGGVGAAHAHGGWADLRRTFNHNMPAGLRNQRSNLNAGLRAVHRASKVRL